MDNEMRLLRKKDFALQVAERVAVARRKGVEQVLCYLDTDQFELDEGTSNELLRQLGELVRSQIPYNCALARLGSDEFGVLFENHSLTEARRIAEGLLHAIDNNQLRCNGKIVEINVCIGLVAIPPDCDARVDALAAAETTCRQARDGGQSRLQVHRLDDKYLVDHERGVRWLSEIPQAIQSGRFGLLRQDILQTGTKLVPGAHFEVLARMFDKENRSISPDMFIPPAEQFGLMSEIDRVVIKKIFAFFANNMARWHMTHTIAINLSAASFHQEGFLDFLHEQIKIYSVAPHLLCFEISESEALSNLDRTVQFMLQLKQLGCRIALDHFGGGLWPFTHLKHLPIDYLKIDGSFVKSVSDSSADLAVVHAIHRVGRAMGMRTIAASVETRDHRDKLAEIGVDYAQGWAIARPQPLNRLADS